jgi:sulfur carrier protein ThiS
MKVVFKLFATLSDLLPPERSGNQVELEVPPGTTVQELIDRYRVPARSAHLVLVNGSFVPPGGRATRQLADNDELAVWPPIAGG